MTHPYEWVDTNQRLEVLAQQWQQQPAIALDTEFIRSRTFFPKTGLLQLADAHGIYLIDPLAVSRTEALQRVLKNSNVVKVIHSCSEDLEVFLRYLSVLPTPLFDTQIAAAFAGYGASLGYASLVNIVHGVVIPKQETRSDWLQRPLSTSQLEYAALDVEHLLPIYKRLTTELENKERLLWMQSDCQDLLDKYLQVEGYDHYYQRVKSAWKLKPRQLSALKQLCAWREKQIRDIDIPRNHLVKDSSLLDMALRRPKNQKDLLRIRDISPRFIKKYGEQCLQMIEEALAEESSYPSALLPPLSTQQTKAFKQLKVLVAERAETLNIPPGFLARKKDLEFLVRSTESITTPILPPGLQGWRETIIGQALLKSINQSV